MPDHIFISYARRDGSNTAKKLFDKLSADKLNPWLDTENGIEPGDSWDDKIEQAIEDCKALVFLMTPASVESEVCSLEWGMAWELKKPLFTVMLEDVKVPFRLRKRQYIDMRDSGFDGKYADLKEAILKLETTAGQEQEEQIREEEQALVTKSGASGKLVRQQRHIPELPEKYIGRKQLQAQIHDSLNKGQRVLLHGQGGQGKTSLAAQIMDTWIEQGHGDVLWLRAGNAHTDELLESFANAVNMTEEFNKANPDDKSDIITEMIELYEIKLIVIDDVWNGLALQNLFKVIPRKLPMLITSRQRQPSTTIIDLPKLDKQDARELIQLHAGEYADDVERVDEICKMLGYLAFAVEIAGKSMQVNMWYTRDIIQEIKDNPHSLKLPEEFQIDGKASVASLIESSLEVLSESTQNVFKAFGAFPQPTLTVEMAEIFLKQKNVQHDMNALVRNGLATRIPETDESIAHYRIHDLAHSYCNGFYDDEDINSVIQACLTYVENHKDESINDFNALESELDNIFDIIEIVTLEKQIRLAMQFTNDLSNLILSRGYIIRALRIYKIIFIESKKINDKEVSGDSLYKISLSYYRLGIYDKSLQYLDLSTNYSQEDQLLGFIYTQYADIYDEYNNHSKVKLFCKKALFLSRKTGNRRIEGNAYNALASSYSQVGKFELSIKYFKKSLNLGEKFTDKFSSGTSINGLGLTYQRMGKYKEAITLYRKDLSSGKQSGDKNSQAVSHTNLAVTYKEMNDPKQSKYHYQKAYDLFKSMNMRHRIKELNQLMEEAKPSEE